MRLSAEFARPGIYMIINLQNGKQYVGSSVNARKRVTYHASGHGSVPLRDAVAKYGRDNFVAVFLEECARERLPIIEAKWIRKIRPAYNIDSLTSSGGRLVSSETGRKISAAKTGSRQTDDAKRKLREDWAMRDHSERCAKIGAAALGRKQSEETRAKRSATMKGRVIPPERRAKMIAAARITKAAKKMDPITAMEHRKASYRKYNLKRAFRQDGVP